MGQVKQCSIAEVPTKPKSTVCARTRVHKQLCFVFLLRPMLSVSLWKPISRLHVCTQGHWVWFFPCLLTLTHRKNYCSYETAKIIKTIKQIHSCDVLSFFYYYFVHLQIDKIQQLGRGSPSQSLVQIHEVQL